MFGYYNAKLGLLSVWSKRSNLSDFKDFEMLLQFVI
jgi:hypothetical protein